MLYLKIIVNIVVRGVFYLLDFIISKDEKIIILASKSGNRRSANLDQLLLALSKQAYYKAYMLSHGSSHIDKINIFSAKGFWKILKAKYVFITHGPGDIAYAWYSPRKIVVYVGHGIPLKTLFYAYLPMHEFSQILYKIELNQYAYIVASSIADQQKLALCFNKNISNVLVTGLPRNEILIENRHIKEKKILYAPTFREYGATEFFPFSDVDLNQLNQFLVHYDRQLYLRGHLHMKDVLCVNNYSHIKLLDHVNCPEIQNELATFEFLITDYSSIFVDFLLLERPIIYIPYDLDDYRKTHGFLYNYEEVLAGPVVRSQKELEHQIRSFIINPKYFQDEIVRVKNLFHQYNDGFSQRLLKRILDNY